MNKVVKIVYKAGMFKNMSLLMRKIEMFLLRMKALYIPEFVWRNQEVCVNIRIDVDKVNRGDIYEIEKLLSRNGILFDTGQGCGGRDWEWDFSLQGPISVFFRGKRKQVMARIARHDRKYEKRKRAKFDKELCGCKSCEECKKPYCERLYPEQEGLFANIMIKPKGPNGLCEVVEIPPDLLPKILIMPKVDCMEDDKNK